MGDNILLPFLDKLNAKYTRQYANNLFYGHPFKNNMYGLKQMLEDYNLKTYGIKFTDKESAGLTFPCILYIGGEFVVATNYQNDKITYIFYGKEVTIPINQFNGIWTGEALVCEEIPDVIVERDYKKNLIQEVISYFSISQLVLLPLLIAGLLYITRPFSFGIISFVDFFINLFGLSICFFLLEKQITGSSTYGDRICSFFHKVSCNFILDDEKAKFYGYSWCEIGYGYFMMRLICWLAFPQFESVCAIINWCAIPFSIWCVSYQIKKNMICTLCMCVQASLCCTAILHIMDLIYGGMYFSVNMYSLFVCGALFLGSVLIVNKVVSSIILASKLQNALASSKAIKSNEEVFNLMLQKQLHAEIPDPLKYTQYGNPKGKYVITVLTNPYCSHCAQMHDRIEKVLAVIGDRIAVQYISEAFIEGQEKACRLLISAHLQLDRQNEHFIMNEWFKKKKTNILEYVNKYNLNLYSKEVDEVLDYYHNWCLSTQLTATPKIFINGCLMPKEYEIEDIIYLV